MRVTGNVRTWIVANSSELRATLASRDASGGAIFWLQHEDPFPTLAIRVSGDLADVMFFPAENHPGFRGLGGAGMPANGTSSLTYDGCDPASGDVTPNLFIVNWETAEVLATQFFETRQMPRKVEWLEL